VQQELRAVGCAHACDQIRPAVFDPLMLGLQDFDGLAVDSEEMACQIGGEPLQGIAADIYPLHVNISPRCTPLAPDSGVATRRNRALAIPPRRALRSGTLDAPHLPKYSRVTGMSFG